MTAQEVLRAGKRQKAPAAYGRNLRKCDRAAFKPAGSGAGATRISV